MRILKKIIEVKQREVALKQKVVPRKQLERSELFDREGLSLARRLNESHTGIIAEFKRRSPSEDNINTHVAVDEVTSSYAYGGASGISVLTDSTFFGGSLDDLLIARASVEIPILRKDFMISEYQVFEAKAHGADVILLIAAALTPERVRSLASLASGLDMEVLLEVHSLEELKENFAPGIDLVGVNNRNLRTFEVDLGISESLAKHIPENVVRIAESGIRKAEDIKRLRTIGYRGFLIGTHFMKQPDPGLAMYEFISNLG